jgi:hypothetical protein
LYSYDQYLKNGKIKSSLEEALNSDSIESSIDALTYGSGIKLVLLIDEYEAPLMECLKPIFKDKYDLVESDYNSFFMKIKAVKEVGLAKCIMTGVICLRNLSAFSDVNSFTNLSLDETYREAFGFTKKEIEEHSEIQKLIDFLLNTRPLPKEVEKMSIFQRRKHFIHALFSIYNGFHFTPKSLRDNISLISPISIVNHMAQLVKDSDANPYDCKQYWAGTGQTRMIKLLAINNIDPTESYAVLKATKQENLDLEDIQKPHNISEKYIPLNLLLFNTGYFTIKKIGNNGAELDWTNQETKEAFFQHYVHGIGFKINDLFAPLRSKNSWNMKAFIERLHDYFARMIKKHYNANDTTDHEQNHTFNLFLELMEYLPRSPGNKTIDPILIFHQYRLTKEFTHLNHSKVPDLLLVFSDDDDETKHIIILKFWY